MRQWIRYSGGGMIIAIMVGCGAGSQINDYPAHSYFSASASRFYQLESQTQLGGDSLWWLAIRGSNGQLIQRQQLKVNGNNSYSFKDRTVSGQVVVSKSVLAISSQSFRSSIIDLATNAQVLAELPMGRYNLLCDQNNLSACLLEINAQGVSITEYSSSGQATRLCHKQSANYTSNGPHVNLFSFECGVSGGFYRGVWHALAVTYESTPFILISEYNPAINDSNPGTDDIAVVANTSVNPVGTYHYLYAGKLLGGSGLTLAEFNSAGIVNPVIGSCFGAACALIHDQYYYLNPQIGFAWFNVAATMNYNLVGSDKLQLYQDSYSGFYF